jgi:hypothetical protein
MCCLEVLEKRLTGVYRFKGREKGVPILTMKERMQEVFNSADSIDA